MYRQITFILSLLLLVVLALGCVKVKARFMISNETNVEGSLALDDGSGAE